MNILDMEPDAFEGALKEMGLEPEREQFLRDEYAKKNTLSGQMLGAFQGATAVPEGKERASVLPMIKPEGMSGLEAIRTGQAELAVPGMVTGAVEDAAKTVTTGEKSTLGIDTTTEENKQAANFLAGFGMSGAATRVGKPLDMTTLSSGGAAGKAKVEPLSFFVKNEIKATPDQPDAVFGTKRLRDIFEEDQNDFTPVTDIPSGFGDDVGWDFNNIGDYNLTELGYARNLPVDTLARYRLGQIDLQEVADSVGEDVSDAFANYVNDRVDKLSKNREFQDYSKKLESDLSFDPWSTVSQALEGKTISDTITFRSPIPDVLDRMAWPAKGKEGYQILSELKTHPNVRKAELDTVAGDIDPKKRYTKEEAQDLLRGNLWDTQVVTLDYNNPNSQYPKWEGYQRQKDLQDPEKGYFELLINSERPTGANFKPKGKHYDEQTLAHSRASVREDDQGEYILPEEFQTDLLQHGYEAPRAGVKKVTPGEYIKNNPEAFSHLDETDKDILKIFAEDRDGNDYNYQSYIDFIEKVGPSNLVPGATTEDILNSLNPNSTPGKASEELLGLYANYKIGDYVGYKSPGTNEAYDLYDEIRDAYYGSIRDNISQREVKAISSPPIKKIEESVKMTLGALIAEADKRGIDRIILPPFERIIERRFPVGSEGYNKALEPKSGFYKTYIESMNKAIKELQDEVGADKVSVRPVDMNYDTNPLKSLESYFDHGMGFSPDNGWADFLDNDLHTELRSFYRGEPSLLDDNDFYIIRRRLKGVGISDSELRDYAASNFRPLSALLREKTPAGLPVTGTEINIRGLRGEDYNLKELRFAEGGMVEDNQMNRLMAEGGMADDGMAVEPTTGNEVPPGALSKEVRDNVDAKLSEGEYVVPADVVRYFGVKFFEDLRSQAKQGLSEMDAQGRIGGAAVDANGVPVEEDLSPEEEQMLMEALGSAPAATGMAEGGDVSQNPAFGNVGFDRKKFSIPANSGFEMRVYYNPTTKEKKTFQVMNGTPIGAIPEGFVPYVEGMENQPIAPTTPDTTTTPKPTTPTTVTPSVTGSGGGSSSNSGGSGGPSGGGTSGGGLGSPSFDYSAWADKNREAIKSDPYQFGLDALTDKSGKWAAKGAAVAGMMTGNIVPLIGGLAVGQGTKVQNIAEAKAALIEMKAQGKADTKEYQNLSKQINSAIDDLPMASQFLVENNIIATASGYTKALNNPNVSSSTRTGTKPTTTATTTTKPATTSAPAKTSTSVGVTSTPLPASRSDSGATSSYKATPAELQKSQSIAAGKTAAAGKSYTSKGGYTSGRAEGGLVKKGAKPKRKGLASK